MSEFDEQGKIWFSGKLVDFRDATIHIMSHVVHYGSCVFEGIRCYATPKGLAIFRLEDHLRRLFDSAKIYRMKIPFTMEEVTQGCKDVIHANRKGVSYLRPLVFRGYGGTLGVDPKDCPTEVVIAAMYWGKYLGDEAINVGVDVRVSSWFRNAPNTTPSLAKAACNYMSGQLIKLEAKADGYVEGIALDAHGYVSEGSGENIFVVYKGVLYTAPIAGSILLGITRDSVITLAKDLGYEVREQMIPREMLYIADEVFFTGTAAEVSPVKSIDRIPIGEGRRGPITEALQKRFFAIVQGEVPDKYGWLSFV